MKKSRFLVSFWETFEIIVIAVISVFIIRHYIMQPFLVKGASMEPTFSSSDYLIVDELTYQFREPKRDEVIVFRSPQNPEVFYIKRIIGLPGEEIEFKDSKIIIRKNGNETTLQEDYLQGRPINYNTLTAQLKSDEYFVMGDNRANSFDSRSWGPLSKKNIIGLARIRLFPFLKMNIFVY